MRIDAHQHFWNYSAAEYPWIGAGPERLARDYLPPDLDPLLAGEGLDGSVAVQARQSVEESRWLLALAEAHPLVKGVVGWVDLRSDRVGDDRPVRHGQVDHLAADDDRGRCNRGRGHDAAVITRRSLLRLASALAWTMFILSQQPQTVARIRAEVRAVAGDGPVELEHARKLPFVRNVFREALRLYPPITFLPRVAAEERRASCRPGRPQVMKARGWTQTNDDDWDFMYADVGWIHENIT
jgi:hypothetical protein